MKPTLVHYGSLHAQVAELWRPEPGPADPPVVVLIHGGFWRQPYTKHLMHRWARAVQARGWAAFNLEYRRVGPFGRGGWPATFEDVSDAIDALSGVGAVDLERVVTCGHSAGGHLALWAGSDRATGRVRPVGTERVRVSAAVSLAGVVDLQTAARLDLGRGAVSALMGGGPDALPEAYALASPASLAPIGIPQYVVHGLADSTVPPDISADYVARARSLGDDATYVPLPGLSHMAMIDPESDAFGRVADWLEERFGPSR